MTGHDRLRISVGQIGRPAFHCMTISDSFQEFKGSQDGGVTKRVSFS